MSIWKTRYDEMIETCAQTGRERDEARRQVTDLLFLLDDIRTAAEDPAGTLNGNELVERCRALRKDRDEARKIAEDMFGVLDELGCGMKPLPWESISTWGDGDYERECS